MFEQSNAFSSYSVNNLKTAEAFYGETLGCQIETVPMGFQLKFPNGHEVFVYEKSNHEPATFTVLNFRVSDINQAIEDLKTKGIEMLRYDDLGLPAEQDERGVLRGKAANMGGDIAWFNDPAGNVLAVVEE